MSDFRKSFEEWFEADAMPCEHSNWFERDGDGDYVFDHVEHAWRGWKGAAGWMREQAAQTARLHPNVAYHIRALPVE